MAPVLWDFHNFPNLFLGIINIYIILLLLSATNSINNSYASAATQPTKKVFTISNFLTTLLTQRLDHCSIVVIRTRTTFLSNNVVPENFYSLQESQDFILRETSRDAFLIELSNSLYENSSIPHKDISSKLQKLRDIHQHRHDCNVALILIADEHNTPNLGNYLYSHLTKWRNILKKHEDYHIFVDYGVSQTRENGQTSLIENELLLSSKIAKGIKLKILVQVQQKKNDVVSGKLNFKLTSTCFYCNYGEPKSVPVLWGTIRSTRHTVKSLDESIQFTTLDNLFPDFSRNFYGKIMQVGTPTGTRWLFEMRFERGVWMAKRGLYKIVMDHLMIKYNFTCNLFPSLGGGGTGATLKNGTWIGSVGSVLQGADLGHTTGQTIARNKVVGYSYPISYETLTFTSGEPLQYFSWKAIYWPLAKELWIGLGLSFILANVMFFFLIKSSKEPFEYTNIIIYTYGSILEQDLPSLERLRANSVRMFICFWLLYTVVIATAYRSKLVSFLAFPNVEEPPKTFEELSNSKYEFALQYIRGAAYALLKTSTNPTYQKIFNKMDLEEDEVKCFERAIGKRFVCISWSKIADFVHKRNLSDAYGFVPLMKSPDSTCFLSVGIIMEKRAIFMTSFNVVIIRATDTGLLERWKDEDLQYVHEERKKWEKETNQTRKNYFVDSSDALTNQHLRGSYYLLAAGTLFGLCAFVGERILQRKNKVILASHLISVH